MQMVPKSLGFATADGEKVSLRFEGGALVLSFLEWGEEDRRLEVVFTDTLAFRWQEHDEPSAPRDDTTYEVIDSPWLARQASLQAVEPAECAHYLLCFNAAGTLDVLCRAGAVHVRRLAAPPS